ncbi:MAG: phosphatase PAP2 family protein [Verrucomicrobiales bacterium]|nr:phosphatase PAP2 family protein [Verrucomicrobiales bacterium]
MFSLFQQWFGNLLSDLEKESSEPRFRWRWILVPLIILIGTTILVRVTNFDMAAQQGIYRAGQGSWSFGEHPFWKSLYRLGTIPTTLVVVLALVGFFLSWSKAAFRRWRRVYLFLFLTAVVGPGIITNALLKEYWGRPRPREINEFGGHNAFEQILSFDPASEGKSFPCGHATMGFYFLCGFFLLRRYRRKLADGILVSALALGGFMGIARMLQGAHFFSDVVWAGAVCWFSAMGLFYAMRLDRGLVREPLPTGRMPLKVKLLAAAAGVVVLSGILLASPYHDIRNYYLVKDFTKTGPINIRLRFEVGQIKIVPGEKFHIEGEAYGHGVPTSGITANYLETREGKFPAIAYVERRSGFLTEANQQLVVTLPWERIHRLRIENMGARVWIYEPRPLEGGLIQLAEGDGEVYFHPAEPTQWKVRGGKNTVMEGEGKLVKRGPATHVLLIEDDFSGRIVVNAGKNPIKAE